MAGRTARTANGDRRASGEQPSTLVAPPPAEPAAVGRRAGTGRASAHPGQVPLERPAGGTGPTGPAAPGQRRADRRPRSPARWSRHCPSWHRRHQTSATTARRRCPAPLVPPRRAGGGRRVRPPGKPKVNPPDRTTRPIDGTEANSGPDIRTTSHTDRDQTPVRTVAGSGRGPARPAAAVAGPPRPGETSHSPAGLAGRSREPRAAGSRTPEAPPWAPPSR